MARMSVNPTTIVPPPGYRAVVDHDGTVSFESTGEILDKTIGWRVPASEYAGYLPFLEAFPERNWATAMRWLMARPAVKAEIAARIEASARPRRSA